MSAVTVRSRSRPRLGFLGVGWIGRNRLQAIARSGHAEVAAIADIAPQPAVEASLAVPGARIMRSAEELLAADLDGLVIATPTALHAGQAQAALERGLAVFCQEPLGRNLTEVRSVVAAARRADRLLGLDLSYRFTQAGRALCGLVRSGELGDIYAVNLVFHSAHGPDKAWFYDRVQSGGGCLIDLGLHLVDLALWCLRFPEVQRVNASLLGGGRPRRAGDDGVEDYASAQLTLASGALVSLACSWRLPAGRDAVIEASFYGTRGGASLHNLGSSFHDFTCERFAGTHRQLLVSPPDDWSGHAAVDWAQRLAGGQRFDGESERFVDVAAIVDQLYASS